MDILNLLSAPLSSFLSYALPFLAVLTIIVFFHELGHFLVARWCGVNVDTFSVGFGREIAGWTDRRGTRWKIGWLPLGGYVKFQGDANAASLPSRDHAQAGPGDFHSASVGKRALIVAAGPIANFLLAIAIFSASYSLVGVPVSMPVVEEVKPGSAAEMAGLQPGDVIKSIDGREITSFTHIQRLVADRAGEELTIEIERDGTPLVIKATPQVSEIPDGSGGTMRIGLLGISRDVSKDLHYEKKGPGEAALLAVQETWFVIERSMVYIQRMVVGAESTDQLAGPLRIAQVSGQAASVSIAALFQLAAVLSISIGLVNLFPIPMLDGGHLLYYGVEAVRGKPLAQSAQELGFKVGLALVLMLMLVATWNDIARLNLF